MLLKSIREIKKVDTWYLALSLSSAFVSSVFPFIPIYMSARIVNDLVSGAEIKTVTIDVLITIVLSFITGIANQLLTKNLQLKSTLLKVNHEIHLNEKLNTLDFAQIEDTAVHALKEKIAENANIFSLGLVRVPGDVAYLFNSIISATIAFFLSYRIFFSAQSDSNFGFAFVMVIAIIISIIINYKCSIIMMSQVSKSTTTLGNVGAYKSFYEKRYLEDNNSAKDIRIFQHQNFILNEIKKNGADKLFAMRNSTSKAQMNANSVVSATNTLLGGLLYFFVTLKAYHGNIMLGEIIQYVGAINRLVAAVTGIAAAIIRIRENTEYVKLYFDYIEMSPSIQTGNRTLLFDNSRKPLIEFKNVSFKYPNSSDLALRNISIQIPFGHKIAIVGENGSGKTTFIKLLCSFYKPFEGRIELDGTNIYDYKSQNYLSLFSVVFQDFKLLAAPIRENIAASANCNDNKIQKCIQTVGLADYIDSLDNKASQYIYTYLDSRGIDFSGGEEQKLALARALYKDAPYMVFDEPTAALDPIAEFEIYRKIREISEGKTVIFISHRLSFCRLCNKIVVFDKGNIVQIGTHEDLLSDTSGKYYQLWTSQAQYYSN